MSIRLLADADLNFAIVTGVRLRVPGIDFRGAAEAGLRGIGDPDVLQHAASQDRILVSHDLRTMPFHFARRIREGKSSPGVFLVSQDVAVSDVIEAVVLICSASLPVEWANRITHLPSLAWHVFSR